jgi:hypothetical protein
MDFVQRRYSCVHDSELSIKSCQHSRISHHTHRQISFFDSDDFLPCEASQGSESNLSQPTIEAALPKLLAEALRDKGVVHVMYT